MPEVRCPDCGAVIELPASVASGDVVECPNCAGHGLRVRQEKGHCSATLAHRVSCPRCGDVVTLPEDAKAGALIRCCGRSYRLTFEYGAFAAEAE
jgi:Zn finger protein HypA/HybF involved in hydrogenase expression